MAMVAAGVLAPRASEAAPDQVDSPVVDWDKRWDRALKDSAAEYAKLAKKYDVKLEATAAYTRRRVLRYLPDDEETRGFLGYIKQKLNDGTENWRWERSDIRRDQLNEMTDLDDPKQTKYSKDLADADRKIVGFFKSLARKSIEYGAAKDAAPDGKWPEKAARAWERVLEVGGGKDLEKDMEEAHKALNHPKFEGKYCSPFKFQYVKARSDRQKVGDKEKNVAIKPVDAVEPDGEFVAAGLKGGGAKSTHFVCNTTHGKEVAIRVVTACEKSLNDLVEVYGFPDNIKERVQGKFNFLQPGDDEFRKLMEKGFEWKPAEVTRHIEAHLTGLTGVKGQCIWPSATGEEVEDGAANMTACTYVVRAAQGMARADIGSAVREDVEDWLWQSIGYDVTKRIYHTNHTHWGAFGRYGDAVEPAPGEDQWVELARRLVQTDNDVPLMRLPKLKLPNKDFKAPQLIKGWAFLQFVFEKDPEKAKKFVWNALANGTANAVAAIYPDDGDSPDPEKSMEKLDAEYREWILKAW
jgi:hypothetical protein